MIHTVGVGPFEPAGDCARGASLRGVARPADGPRPPEDRPRDCAPASAANAVAHTAAVRTMAMDFE